MHDESDEVTEPTCTTVMRPGYKHNDRLLRAGHGRRLRPRDTAAGNQNADESADADSE